VSTSLHRATDWRHLGERRVLQKTISCWLLIWSRKTGWRVDSGLTATQLISAALAYCSQDHRGFESTARRALPYRACAKQYRSHVAPMVAAFYACLGTSSLNHLPNFDVFLSAPRRTPLTVPVGRPHTASLRRSRGPLLLSTDISHLPPATPELSSGSSGVFQLSISTSRPECTYCKYSLPHRTTLQGPQ
jgi:hypothetical protein